MKTFKDDSGRQWSLAVNVTSIKRVRDLCKVDLLTIVEGKLIDQLLRDPFTLVNVVYVLCKPQADERGISDEQFGEAMAGDAMEGATTALLEDLSHFFRPGQRAALRAALAKVSEAETAAMAQAVHRIKAIDVASLMPPASGGSSGNVLASAE